MLLKIALRFVLMTRRAALPGPTAAKRAPDRVHADPSLVGSVHRKEGFMTILGKGVSILAVASVLGMAIAMFAPDVHAAICAVR